MAVEAAVSRMSTEAACVVTPVAVLSCKLISVFFMAPGPTPLLFLSKLELKSMCTSCYKHPSVQYHMSDQFLPPIQILQSHPHRQRPAFLRYWLHLSSFCCFPVFDDLQSVPLENCLPLNFLFLFHLFLENPNP